ncbi:MAG: hypothetical protein AB7O24_18750 [Kofleriaceae bacterium]
MSLRILAATTAVISISSTAFADHDRQPAVPASSSPSLHPAVVGTPALEIAEVKSPNTAFALALGATVAGAALLGATMYQTDPESRQHLGLAGLAVVTVGPSIGHFYSGEVGRGALSTGIRVGALGVSALGMSMALSDLFCSSDCHDGEADAGVAIMLGGLALATGAAIYDIADAPSAARRANVRAARGGQLTVVPKLSPNGSAGMAVVGTF